MARNTFHAGLASAKGRTDGCMVCTVPAALIKLPTDSVNGVMGNNTSANSNSSLLANALSAMTVSALANAKRACSGLGKSESGSTLSKRTARALPSSIESMPALGFC